jgi:hypothetical protein
MDFGVFPMALKGLLRPDFQAKKKSTFPAWHQTLAGLLKFSTFISDL